MIDLRYLTIPKRIPNFIYRDIKEYAKKSNIYHPQPNDLIGKLSNKHNISPKNIFLTAGCDEAILAVKNTYDRLTIYFTPTYSEYRHSFNNKIKYMEINSLKKEKYTIKPKKFPKKSLIFIANPNNPFGVTSVEQLRQLITLNSTSIIVIDEAYSSFTNLSVIEDTKRYKNLVVLRSFSKDYGLAGIRVGYIVASNEVLEKVRKNVQITNTSYLSIGAAISALDHEDYFKKQILGIKKAKEKYCHMLTKYGYVCISSDINAIIVKFNSENETINFCKYLQKNEVYISNDSSNLGLESNYARIAIGNKDEMIYVMKVAKEYSHAILY